MYKNIALNKYEYDQNIEATVSNSSVSLEKVLPILKNTMNSVTKVSSGPSENIAILRAHISAGGGLLCGGMALLLKENLAEKGIPARIVTFRRELNLIGDTHVSVEIPVDGRWILVDPTFHTLFRSGGEFLGAHDLRRAIESGRNIHGEFLGDVEYPARIEDYYIDIRPLADNIFVLVSTNAFWKKLPPFRYYLGTHLIYGSVQAERRQQYERANTRLLVYSVILPLLIMTMGLYWLRLIWRFTKVWKD